MYGFFFFWLLINVRCMKFNGYKFVSKRSDRSVQSVHCSVLTSSSSSQLRRCCCCWSLGRGLSSPGPGRSPPGPGPSSRLASGGGCGKELLVLIFPLNLWYSDAISNPGTGGRRKTWRINKCREAQSELLLQKEEEEEEEEVQ